MRTVIRPVDAYHRWADIGSEVDGELARERDSLADGIAAAPAANHADLCAKMALLYQTLQPEHMAEQQIAKALLRTIRDGMCAQCAYCSDTGGCPLHGLLGAAVGKG